MSLDKKITRREFIEKSTLGTAGLTIASTFGVPALLTNPNPSDVIGIGMVGIGIRGSSLLRQIMNVSGTQVRGVCDAYTPYLERAANTVKGDNPDVISYVDYHDLMRNKNIDAVIIATPDHLHAPVSIAAAEAGKDIYVEKPLTRTIPEAINLVNAVKKNKRVLQLGHGARSSPSNWRAREIYKSGMFGHVTLVRTSMFRNSASGAWVYNIPPEAGPDSVDWGRFLENAPEKRTFDLDRFFRWRKYWDYGTGVAGDMFSHSYDAVNFILDLGIPKTCVANGGVYYWKEKREVPDVFNAVWDYPDRGLALTFNSTFSNSSQGVETGTQIFGDKASYTRGRVFLEPSTDRNREIIEKLREERIKKGEEIGEREAIPVYTYTREDGLYFTSHMQNFIDCVRSRQKPRCHEDVALEEAVTCIMSVIAYKEGRRVTWDPVKQEVV